MLLYLNSKIKNCTKKKIVKTVSIHSIFKAIFKLIKTSIKSIEHKKQHELRA